MEYNIPCSALVVCVDWMKDKFHMEEALNPITVAITLNTSGKCPVAPAVCRRLVEFFQAIGFQNSTLFLFQ